MLLNKPPATYPKRNLHVANWDSPGNQMLPNLRKFSVTPQKASSKRRSKAWIRNAQSRKRQTKGPTHLQLGAY